MTKPVVLVQIFLADKETLVVEFRKMSGSPLCYYQKIKEVKKNIKENILDSLKNNKIEKVEEKNE